jgi:internalin A
VKTLTDISPLANLTELTNLNISYNQINDISALASLTKLEALGMSLNQISDLSPLSALPLSVLYADTNQITDITPLVTIPTFVEASQLDVRSNPLDCTAQAENLAALEARGVALQSDCN